MRQILADPAKAYMNGLNVFAPAKREEPSNVFKALASHGGPTVAAGNALAGGHDHAIHAGQSHGDWLKYSNTGAIRDKPLSDRLVSALSFLPELGVEMRVISGGQDAKGHGHRRTGSTRHDHGEAADADFYMNGRKLDWNNPQDVPIFQEIVRRSRANGITGIGAGNDYMGAGRMHIGFGKEAVWGAGGKGDNAPPWLRNAFTG